jgi:alkylated DNA repair dioxygenase AlkB
MKHQDLMFEPANFSQLNENSIEDDSVPVAPLVIIRQYLNLAQQQALLNEADGYAFVRPLIKVFGHSVAIPRCQVWFGDRGCDYCFSSLLIKAQPWPQYVRKLRNKLARDYGTCYNGVLVNYYANGSQSVGWHSDNEPEIVASADIASLTLGASRDFILRHNQTQHKVSIQLHSGDLLLMKSPMQQSWQHTLPKRLKVTTPRINYTFRLITPNFHL